MPTHQGKTQTTILIGDGGESAHEDSEFEFFATYSNTATLQHLDLAPGTDRQHAGYELLLHDDTGAVLATFAARFKAWIDQGGTSGTKSISIVNTFDPLPNSSSPNWPLSTATIANREWRVDTFNQKGNLFGRLNGLWQLRSTVASPTATVIQTVTDQTDSLLRVHLVYMDGPIVLLDVVVTMPTIATVAGNITADPPDVIDRFTP